MADEKLEVEVRANINGLDRDMAAASKSVKGLGDASDVAAKKAEAHARKMEDLKRASTDIGKSMLVAGAAIGAGVALAVVEFAKYDKAASGYRAVSQATRAEMDALGKSAMSLGEKYGFTAVEAVNAATALNKAGVSTADVLSGALSGALTLAATDTIEVAEAAEVAAIAMTQFKLQGKDVPHIVDLLAAGAGQAVGDVKDLSWGLRQSGLVAAQFGLGIEETVGTLSAFASAGLIGSDAGTSFKQMLLSLASPSGVAAKKMAELGLSAYDAQGDFIGIEGLAGQLQERLGGLSQESRNAALSIIFGQDAIRSASVLYEIGAKGVAEWTEKVDKSGYASKIAAERLNNLNGDWKKLTVSVQNALIDMGGASDSFLRPLIQSVTDAVQSFRDLPEPVKGGILAVAGLTAGALLLVGAVMTAVPKIVEFKESWDKLSAAGGKHSGILSRVTTAVSGVAAAYLAARVAINLMGDAINANDKKASSTDIINRIAGGARSPEKISPALDKSFEGITNPNNSMFTRVNDFGSALKRIYKPTKDDSFQDFTSDVFNKESGGGFKSRQAFGQLDKSLADLATSGSTADAAATFAEMEKRAKAVGVPIEDLIKLVPNYKDAMIGVATQNGITNISEEEKAKILSGNSLLMGTAAEKTAAMAKVQEAAKAESEQWSEALAEIGISLQGTIADLATFTDWLVQAGLVTLSSREATAQFEEAIDGVGAATEKILASQGKLGPVLQANKADFDLTTQAGRDANGVFADMATKGLAAATAMAKNGDSQPAVQEQLKKTHDAMIQTAIGFGMGKDEAEALTRGILHIPQGVSVDTWMADKARLEAEKTKAAMDAINGKVVKTYIENHFTNFLQDIKKPTIEDINGDTFRPPGKAGGGAVMGQKKGFDSQPHMLAPGEHVLTSNEVDLMGGQQAVYAMRAAIRSGAAYRPAAAPATAAGQMGHLTVFVQNPWTGEQVRAVVQGVAAGEAKSALASASRGASNMRGGSL
ncbi:MAG TPA: phage tail tape measure protein [Arthrobacter sp.]